MTPPPFPRAPRCPPFPTPSSSHFRGADSCEHHCGKSVLRAALLFAVLPVHGRFRCSGRLQHAGGAEAFDAYTRAHTSLACPPPPPLRAGQWGNIVIDGANQAAALANFYAHSGKQQVYIQGQPYPCDACCHGGQA